MRNLIRLFSLLRRARLSLEDFAITIRATSSVRRADVTQTIDQNWAARTIASVVKNDLSTAPMLMYQHSFSGVSIPGR